MGGYLFQQNYGFQVGDYLKKSMTYQREIIHTETCALLSKLQGEEHIETGISLSKREIGGQK